MREMLRDFIGEELDLEVCGSAASGEEALESLKDADVDLVLVDVSLPKMSGIELVQQLQARRPELRCLMLSGHGESGYVQRSLAAGAKGYIMKGNPYEIPEAITTVLDGGMYLSEQWRDK